MKSNNKSWNFVSEFGDFYFKNANRINRLYFPLFNLKGFMSAITPDLKGDIKTSLNTFLMEPQVTENLSQTKVSRNFWIKTDNGKIWSIPGVSSEETYLRAKNKNSNNTDVLGGPGYFSIIRSNKSLNIDASINIFVPFDLNIEVSIVKIKNTSNKNLNFTPYAAIPIYARSASNLRDHRQVTTLLNRVKKLKNGIIVTPTMSFDERGHKKGLISYSAFGFSDQKNPIDGVVCNLETFIGEGGSLESPELIYSDKAFKDITNLDGKQIIAALKYKNQTLKPNEEKSFVFILGIHDIKENIQKSLTKVNSSQKASIKLKKTKEYWKEQASKLKFKTKDESFNA